MPLGKQTELSRTLQVMKSPFHFLRASADDHRIENLKGLSLFKRLTVRELRELDQLLHERSYQKEEVIFDEGDTGLGLFIVVSGRVKIESSQAALQRLARKFARVNSCGLVILYADSC